MIFDLWDIDNCIADDGWRIKFIDWTQSDADERYRPYHARCPMDEAGNVQHFARAAAGAMPVFFTARPEWTREHTVAWLRSRMLNSAFLRDIPIKLFMRQEREFVPSAQLKEAMLGAFLAQLGVHDAIRHAYDDRADICDMYRRHGIVAYELRIHDICAYTNPLTLEQPHGR